MLPVPDVAGERTPLRDERRAPVDAELHLALVKALLAGQPSLALSLVDGVGGQSWRAMDAAIATVAEVRVWARLGGGESR
jgi:hypothetical protein